MEPPGLDRDSFTFPSIALDRYSLELQNNDHNERGRLEDSRLNLTVDAAVALETDGCQFVLDMGCVGQHTFIRHVTFRKRQPWDR